MTALSDELTTDPLARGYSGMTDAEATADLSTAYRTRYRPLDTRDILRWGFAREGLIDAVNIISRCGTVDLTEANCYIQITLNQ